MPALTGYGLRDAVYRLERMGLRVKVRGVGRVVRQNVKPGTAVRKGTRVELLLSTDPKHISDEEDTELPTTTASPDSVKKDSLKKQVLPPPTPTKKAPPTQETKEKTAALLETHKKKKQ